MAFSVFPSIGYGSRSTRRRKVEPGDQAAERRGRDINWEAIVQLKRKRAWGEPQAL